MKRQYRKTTGILLVGLVNGVAASLSVPLAMWAHRQYGWSLFGSMGLIMIILIISFHPVKRSIARKYSND